MAEPVRRRRMGLRLVAVAAVALTATGCLQNPNPTGGAGGGGLGGFVDGGTADGDKNVTILGAFGGAEAEAFEASLVAFEEESGIDVQYTPDQDFTTTVKQKVNSGDSPDIGLFPQPGGLLEFAAQDKVNPIDTYLDYESLDSTLVPGLLESARYRGRVYGAPMRLAVKSLVWYPKPSWEDGGYSVEPTSMQDLASVTDTVKGDGVAPWCMGWESDQATGWVGTDWIEEIVLRMWGPDVYDQWVSHEIPFNDERIVQSFEEFGKLAKTEGNVLGGSRGILNTPFGETMNPAFGPDPQCYLMRQGNFASGFLPADVQSDLDAKVGIFVYPPFEGGFEGQAILGGGDIAGLFNGNDDDAKAVMQFLTSDQFGGEWAKAGGWLSPHTTFDATNYPNETTRQMAEIASSADVFRFDGSDLMPKEVGSGTFWTGMVEWMSGASSQETADKIEASWPQAAEQSS
ncbi:ABC transporter substrate-binding protein [Fodinibacter luteus]|uniref:ABC transporter substrate-binding protein n=1 Tax=Fodinibacter luteus TaxID=552064 RepID=UPI0031EC5EC1